VRGIVMVASGSALHTTHDVHISAAMAVAIH
jgi:hypothetical protein